MKEQLIQKILNAFSGYKEAMQISADDFTEERQDNMIVVGIENIEQMNVGLPDYRATMTVTIDTFIEGDETSELFNSTVSYVKRILDEYVMRHHELNDLFEDIPVVGFFFDGKSQELTETSNRAILRYSIIVSY